jgi:sulfatase maturation enzyme AslB (radical SAM superfamily)
VINLKKNKAFCIMPFIHIHVSEKNDLKLCCLAQDDVKLKPYTDEFDFVADPDFQEIRTKLLAGERIPHCQNCYTYEDGGAESSRIRDTKEWIKKLNIESVEQLVPELVYYDIRNDNLCNLSCRMCNPQFSSQLVKEYKALGWFWDEDEPRSFGFNNVVDMATVKKIYVAGGEPSLMPEFRKFLKRAIEAGRTDIEIRMSTNATNLNREYCELLGHFPNLDIICSIDGYDQVNKYIRWPADWATITENIHELCKITPRVAFNVTVSIWNIARLNELIRFFDANFERPVILLNQVMHPPWQRFEAFPDKAKALADLERIKMTKSYRTDRYAGLRAKVDYFIKGVYESEVNLDDLKKFFEYNDALDNSRGVKLADYIPELEAARSLLK